jgi:hypothetical protein
VVEIGVEAVDVPGVVEAIVEALVEAVGVVEISVEAVEAVDVPGVVEAIVEALVESVGVVEIGVEAVDVLGVVEAFKVPAVVPRFSFAGITFTFFFVVA